MDVTGTLAPAWERTKRVLFRPFDVGTWFSFGLIFWLAELVEGGMGSLQFPSFGKPSGGRGGAFAPDMRATIEPARAWVAAHLATVIAASVIGGAVLLALALVVLWLGTRGQMMAIRAVATGRADVGEHWRATARAGWALFRAYLVLGVVGFVLGAPLLGLAAYRFVALGLAGAPDDALFVALVPLGVALVALSLVLGIAQAVLRNLVAPVMLRHDERAGAAWSRFRAAARGSFGAIVLFFVIRAALQIGATLVALVVMLFTCCIGALPIVRETILAPWFHFERAYGLYAIESLGPEMKMFET